MATAASRSTARTAVSLLSSSSQLQGLRCSSSLLSIPRRSLLARERGQCCLQSILQHEVRSSFHTLSRSGASPAQVPRYSISRPPQQLRQQRPQLGHNALRIQLGSQTLQCGKRSYYRPRYRRFDGRVDAPRAGGYVGWFWRSYRNYIIAGGTISVGFYVYNLEDTPITGRKRFNCVSESQEIMTGEQGYRQLMAELRGRTLPESHPHVQTTKRVLSRLISASQAYDPKARDMKWELHVIAGNETNAFVLPGGKVFVFTGILPVCRDEDGLAAVLGHEISHILLHHPAERMSSSALSMVGVLAFSLIFDVTAHIRLLSMASNLLFEMPHSRNQESEADRVGLMLMSRSCYDPQSAVKLWDRMNRLGEAAPPELLSTHPSNSTRLTAMQEQMPEAQSLFEDSGCGGMMSAWYDQVPRRSRAVFTK